jgi:FkbM family methyltransferase
MQVDLPFDVMTRISILAGNLRVQRIIDASVNRGDSVVDVGAHIGINTLYMAMRVGPPGHVIAVEPAPDNLDVLRRNVAVNRLDNVTVHPVAAGKSPEMADFYLRGPVSAVNSRYAESFYAPVTRVVRVAVAPLDDLVDRSPRLVKIDVEGGELDVLEGMPRLLSAPSIQLIVEWHPVLQQAAGHAPDALPRALWTHGFELRAASHRRVVRLVERDLAPLLARLQRQRRPVELWAGRA